jgi:hypothetical protein
MSDEEHKRRKTITFEQAEGAASLPYQLQPQEMSQKLRGALWVALYQALRDTRVYDHNDNEMVGPPYDTILGRVHTFHYEGWIDEFDPSFDRQTGSIKKRLADGSYIDVLGFVQAILRDEDCPDNFRDSIRNALRYANAAYVVVDDDTIVPKGSPEEAAAIDRAFGDLRSKEFVGARQHLKNAADLLSAGKYAESVRESIHSVESVARVLELTADLSKALSRLEQRAEIHGAMKKGFLALYGYTSDERGIRHPLLDEQKSNVDETDAMFMIGACASFNSYMINRARQAGLLEPTKIR